LWKLWEFGLLWFSELTLYLVLKLVKAVSERTASILEKKEKKLQYQLSSKSEMQDYYCLPYYEDIFK